MPIEQHTVYVDLRFTKSSIKILEDFAIVIRLLVDLREDMPWRADEIDEAGEAMKRLVEQLRADG